MKAGIIDLEKIKERIDNLRPIVEEGNGMAYSARELGEMEGELRALENIFQTSKEIPVVSHWNDLQVLECQEFDSVIRRNYLCANYSNGVIIKK